MSNQIIQEKLSKDYSEDIFMQQKKYLSEKNMFLLDIDIYNEYYVYKDYIVSCEKNHYYIKYDECEICVNDINSLYNELIQDNISNDFIEYIMASLMLKGE